MKLGVVAILLTVIHCRAASAQHLDSAACRSAFGLTQSHPWPPVTPQNATVLPSNPTADDVITICTVDFVYPDYVGVVINGNHITATVFDNGFSWLPNPVIAVERTIGKLPAGTYTLDAYIDANWTPRPPWYPRTVASGVSFSVVAALPVPTLNDRLMVLLGAIVAVLGALSVVHPVLKRSA